MNKEFISDIKLELVILLICLSVGLYTALTMDTNQLLIFIIMSIVYSIFSTLKLKHDIIKRL